MQHALKAVQRIHLGIMGASAALVILASSPHRAAVYEGALSEIRQLGAIPLDSAAYQLTLMAEAAIDTPKSTRDSLNWVLVLHRLTDAGGLFWNVPPPGPLGGTDLRVDSISLDGTIEQIAAAVRRAEPVRRIRPGRMLLADPKSVFDSAGCGPSSGVPVRIPTLSGPVTRTRDCGMSGYAAVRDSAGYAAHFARMRGVNHVGVRVVRLETLEEPIGELSNRAWIADRDSSLFSESGVFLPRSRAIWEQVKALRIPEAEALLRERILEREGQVSLLGVDVAERAAVIGGPGALVLLLALFVLHLNHLQHRMRVSESALADIAWAPLFPGWEGRAVRWATTAVLPTLAAIAILSRSWRTEPLAARAAEVTLCVLIAGLGVLSARRISELRTDSGRDKKAVEAEG